MSPSAPAGSALSVLLMGYGSPDGPGDLTGYLTDVLHGRPPPPGMVEEYERRYAQIGGSPQNRILRSLRGKLEARLREEVPDARVHLGTKHWRPNVADVIPQAAAEGVRRLVAIPLSPYASTWILEPYRSAIEAGRRAAASAIDVELRAGWHTDSHWVGYWARAIRTEIAHARDRNRAVLLSAHSLPERYRDRGDPYPEVLAESYQAIARAAALDRWSFTYQSAGNTTEKWLGPDITEVMLEWQRRGAKTQIVASFGFVFDHLEVLYDLDVAVREFATERGIDYRRVPMPNDHADVVEALRDVALRTSPVSASVSPAAGTRS